MKSNSNRRNFLKNLSIGVISGGEVLKGFNDKDKKFLDETNTKNEFKDGRNNLNLQYSELSIGEITPNGWLKRQLEIMKDGTTGHLDEVYEKVRDRNGWLGGDGDGWEETPYWLDGAVPLAFILKSKELIEKIEKYIEWSLTNQRESGYFGPITKSEMGSERKISINDPEDGEDWWPKMIMLKVMKQYYSATQDERVIDFLDRYFKYQLAVLRKCPLEQWTLWAKSRGAENVSVIHWFYGIKKKNYLLELARLIESQSFEWSEWFQGRDWVINAAAYQDNKDWMHRHGVNVAMGLKDPILKYEREGDIKFLKAFEVAFNDLMSLHGLPNGMFSADEDIHGNDPIQGHELCAVVETMFSLEKAIQVTGNVKYVDALEKITFNALPSQTTDDYNNKQYFQIANQVEIKKGVFNFSLPFDREMNNVLGMKSGYTCCLANMHQGWPKFTNNLWYKTSKGLAALLYSPSIVNTKINGSEISIEENTEYPFGDKINFKILCQEQINFELSLRIPGWCKQAEVIINGNTWNKFEGGQIVKINRNWENKDAIQLVLPMGFQVKENGRNSRSIERGPLVYALKLEEVWKEGVDEKEGKYFSVSPKGDWNYGIIKDIFDMPDKNIDFHTLKRIDSKRFNWNLENVPSEIEVKARKIPSWIMLDTGVAPTPVTDRNGLFKGKVGEEIETITLVPIGFTKTRIVAFPTVLGIV